SFFGSLVLEAGVTPALNRGLKPNGLAGLPAVSGVSSGSVFAISGFGSSVGVVPALNRGLKPTGFAAVAAVFGAAFSVFPGSGAAGFVFAGISPVSGSR